MALEDDRVLGSSRFSGFIDTPREFQVFREFIVAEGLARAPELLQIRASIDAQERDLERARRAYWSPTVGLQATLDEVLGRAGAGSGPGPGLTSPEDTSWSVGVNASLALFSGGSRRADSLRAHEELTRLQLLYEATAERVEQQIRSQAMTSRAAYASIALSQEAADAAGKNLDLVADAYSRGALSILDLLDAQSASLNADLQATNSVYDFFIELMRVQRSVSRFNLLQPPEDTEAWLDRLERFFSDRSARPEAPLRREETP